MRGVEGREWEWSGRFAALALGEGSTWHRLGHCCTYCRIYLPIKMTSACSHVLSVSVTVLTTVGARGKRRAQINSLNH